jgi:hypothetical protein
MERLVREKFINVHKTKMIDCVVNKGINVLELPNVPDIISAITWFLLLEETIQETNFLPDEYDIVYLIWAGGYYNNNNLVEDISRRDIEMLERAYGIQLSRKDFTEITTPPNNTIAHVVHKFWSYIKENAQNVFCIRIGIDEKIEVRLKLEDGSWCYAGGTGVLPSNIYILSYSKWGKILKELEDLINDEHTAEQDLQRFLEDNPALIKGMDYDVVVPQAVIVKEDDQIWKSDFILKPKDQYAFAKVLELKIPSIPIIKRPQAGHVTFSAKIWNAIQQLKDYRNAFNSVKTRDIFRKKYGIDVFKPDLHLIAGRKWDIQVMDAVRELQENEPVKIENWDSFIDRLKRTYT